MSSPSPALTESNFIHCAGVNAKRISHGFSVKRFPLIQRSNYVHNFPGKLCAPILLSTTCLAAFLSVLGIISNGSDGQVGRFDTVASISARAVMQDEHSFGDLSSVGYLPGSSMGTMLTSDFSVTIFVFRPNPNEAFSYPNSVPFDRSESLACSIAVVGRPDVGFSTVELLAASATFDLHLKTFLLGATRPAVDAARSYSFESNLPLQRIKNLV